MKNLQWWLMKIYRISALIMLIAVILYIVSGYGLSKGLIDEQNARLLHLNILPVVIVLAFIGHVSLAIRVTLMRWQLWNKFTMAALIVVFGALLGGFIYVEYFYGAADAGGNRIVKQERESIQRSQEQNEQGTSVAPSNETTKIFTPEELSTYNGLNGMPAYAAIDGVVYDLSAVFAEGMHNGNAAGIDQTTAFYEKHMAEILKKHPVVGKLAE